MLEDKLHTGSQFVVRGVQKTVPESEEVLNLELSVYRIPGNKKLYKTTV